MKITAIRGFKDILPKETLQWQKIEESAKNTFSRFAFKEIKLPIIEKTSLFKRSIGETTDIVEKEMYTFLDRKEESLTLRPEGTAPCVRAYIENNLNTEYPVTKLYYFGPMFRYERPQKGRYRQFYQIGAEVFGSASARTDAETLLMAQEFLNEAGIKNTVLNINSLGCKNCRPTYRETLLKFLKTKTDELCENCVRRIDDNPLRALDCKASTCIEATEDAPSILESLCADCDTHFEEVKKTLKTLDVDYEINHRMVRGLDYYNRTTFEVVSDKLGAQNTVLAGGRYDSLVKDLGGMDTPCFGFAAGMERLALLLDNDNQERDLTVIIPICEEAQEKASIIAKKIRELGKKTHVEYDGKNLKKKLTRANKLLARNAVIIGEDEIEKNIFLLRDMEKGTQETYTEKELLKVI